MSDKKERILPLHKYEPPCTVVKSRILRKEPRRVVQHHDAFPRECKFAYMTPGYYATGFRILDVYKTEVDFTEMRSLMFLEDPKEAHKWEHLKSRLPFPETRVTDLPGTRDLHYHNYCMRSLTPESAMSWRNSIAKPDDYYPCEEELEDGREVQETI